MFAEIVRGMWEELPEGEGARLYAAQLAKGAGHKYIRRVPKPGGGYRYYYRVTGGKGLAHDDEIVEGAKFKVRGGHYHVEEVVGDLVKVVHDETGKVLTVNRAELRRLLRGHHASAIEQAKVAARAERDAASVHGSVKQARRAHARHQQVEGMFPGPAPAPGRAARGGTPPRGRGRKAKRTAPPSLVDKVWGMVQADNATESPSWPHMTREQLAGMSITTFNALKDGLERKAESGPIPRSSEPLRTPEQARRDMAAPRRRTSSGGAARKATAKQVDYLAALVRKLGDGWYDYDDFGGPPPRKADIAKMSSRDASAMIDDLRKLVGNTPGRYWI